MTLALKMEDAASIPYVTPAEAEQLARVELDRLVALLESLEAADWAKPTACVKWSVRDMTAHQAGSYASGTSYGELFRQYSAAAKPRQLPEDSINERQLADRAGKSPDELIAEIKATGDAAVRNWAHGFRPLKALVVMPHPVPGWLSLRHLMLVIHSRDTWIHRLDICRATGRPFEQTADHDGRITELVVLDLAKTLAKKLGGRAIALELDGIAGGIWRIGKGEPEATVRLDTLDFNIYASGRTTPEDAARTATFSGDRSLAERAFRSFSVLY
jgi:uncharacterized protein (TIGR03083 family)